MPKMEKRVGKNKNQNYIMKKKINSGSQLPQEMIEAKHHDTSNIRKGAVALPTSSFSTYFYLRNHGKLIVNCRHWAVTPNSRVVVSASEYDSNPATNRFIGQALFDVNNVAPYQGGFFVWLTVYWDNHLNIRIDAFIDPS